MKNQYAIFTLVFLTIGFFLPPRLAQAVTPAPDGGYPNFTTAEGQNALLHLTTGAGNTGVGWFSLDSVTTGSFNTAIGAGTLALNGGDENTGVGTAALLLNTASGNTAVGSRALLNNTTGGTLESVNDIDLGPNVAIGTGTLESNTVSSSNTAVGYQALHSFISGIAGFPQLGLNTAIGFQALANTNGANGGSRNSGFGYQALFNNTDGFENVAIGDQALFGNVTGFRNTAIGGGAGSNVTTASNVICIGWGQGGGNIDNSCFVGNIVGVPIVGNPVVVAPSGQLGEATSSRRFKTAIEPMDKASEALFSLKLVTFRYKKDIDPKGSRQLGLVAEEVEKVDPNLVVHDKEGKPYTVRYEQVNAMLLNEFLKEHGKVKKLEAALAKQRNDFDMMIAELKKELERVVTHSKEQDGRIEKVSAHIQLNKAEARTLAEK